MAKEDEVESVVDIPLAPSDASSDHQVTWTRIIEPDRAFLAIPFREIWQYRDLLLLLVRRDFVALYKQTILGPIWFVLQPVMMTIVFTIVFGNIAQISTDGLPQVLFYLAGVTMWTYFQDSLIKTSETFTLNANIFGKVYFPRIIVPLSVVVSGLLKFAVQFTIFLAFAVYYTVSVPEVAPNAAILLLPLLLLLMGVLGLSIGMIISALTTKYRDLRFLMTFGVQLLMYATPVIYPVSAIPEAYRSYILANPITPIIETFRYAFTGAGTVDVMHLTYSCSFAVVALCVALVIFNQVEKNFMDTV
ncbi:ABC transporter permease [Sulfitobacter sp. JL08]|uniref:ABC transporter permease n=1 Tax=Sulfitobacter sp. JL08 TaxID=2070369 RepID=UPI000E0AEEB4|nr:ABC transporter permease [Sulfitobacter sp. JL08]AXI54117.1 ABC transporter permease [Sulfitobacter sp. JL08]